LRYHSHAITRLTVTTMSRNLLFVTPMVPGLTTSGSSMRAGMVLQALTKHFEVYVLLVPLGSRAAHRALPDQFADLRPRFLVVDDSAGTLFPQFRWWRDAPDAGDAAVNAFVEEALRPWRHVQFDAVHIYRLPLAAFARAFDRTTVKRFLDIDDIESITSDRLAELYRQNDRMRSARSSRRYAKLHRLREQRLLGNFDGVFVCSRDDAVLLRRMYQCPAFVLPNTVTLPPIVPSQRHAKLTILFVGSMDYHPNEDAALRLAEIVLPCIHRSCQSPAEVLIVGNRPTHSVLALGNRRGVTVTGVVDSVTPYYRQATVAVVPLRAGGGTRIKILEAAAHQVPVVSTPMGAEGLDAADECELLLAQTPEQMARQCVRLWQDDGLRSRIISNAYSWVERKHTLSALDQALADAYKFAGLGYE
jgi:polysaccharide biosynthesis protein PslH